MRVHLRKPGSVATYCGASGLITATPASTDCAKCCKAAGIGKYDALKALGAIVTFTATKGTS